MTKEEIIELLNKPENEITELSTDKAYVIKLEVGDMPKEQVIKYVTTVKAKLFNIGLKDTILIPTHNGIGDLTFIEVKE